MPTSGVTEWSLTARDLVRQALIEGQIISPGEDPTADEMSDCILRLNGMLKSWQAKGVTPWREQTGTITVPADSPNGTVAEGIREITAARVVNGPTYERQLAIWERDDYLMLPNKAAKGKPTALYQSRQLGGLTVYLWPVPTTETILAIDYVRSIETITDASQTLDFAEEYQEAIYANLAVRCAGMFGQQPGPELVSRAARLERQMEDDSRPRSYFMDGDCA